MSNKELFKQTFSELHASEDKVMEAIKMKGKKNIKHFPAKKIIAIAACVGTILTTGVVANAATDGAIMDNIIWFVNSNGEKTQLNTSTEYSEKTGEKIITASGEDFQLKIGEKDCEITVDGDTHSYGVGYEIDSDGDTAGEMTITQDPDNEEMLDGIDFDGYTTDGIYKAKNNKGQDVVITVEDNGKSVNCKIAE